MNAPLPDVPVPTTAPVVNRTAEDLAMLRERRAWHARRTAGLVAEGKLALDAAYYRAEAGYDAEAAASGGALEHLGRGVFITMEPIAVRRAAK